MAHTFTDDDEGKTVVNEDGEDVGIVTTVEHGTAHVNPDPGVTDKIKSTLGWGDGDDEDTYPLQEESVDSVTDDEIRLGSSTTAGAGGAGTAGATGTADTTDTSTTGSDTDDMRTDDDDGLMGDDDDDSLIGDDNTAHDDDDSLIGDDDNTARDDDDSMIGDDDDDGLLGDDDDNDDTRR